MSRSPAPNYSGDPGSPIIIQDNFHYRPSQSNNFQNLPSASAVHPLNPNPPPIYPAVQQNWRWQSQNPYPYLTGFQAPPQSTWMANGIPQLNGRDIEPTETTQNPVGNHGSSNSRNDSPHGVTGGTGRNQQNGPDKMYLHFELEDSPHLLLHFKISDKEIFNIPLTSDLKKIRGWVTIPRKKWANGSITKVELMKRAKFCVLIVNKFGNKGLRCLLDDINIRLVRNSKNTVYIRMIVLYLTYLMIGVERANFQSSLLCEQFESIFTRGGLFRDLVTEATPPKQNELYSLRWRLGQYFSPQSLQTIDSRDFWRKLRVQQYPDYQVPNEYSSSQTIQNGSHQVDVHDFNLKIENFDMNERDLDMQEISVETIGDSCDSIIVTENLIKVDWIIEFPMQEETKKRLTDIYSVKKPFNRLIATSLYGKYVEFNIEHFSRNVTSLLLTTEKEKFVNVAKEAFFIESVFGNNQVGIVAELLTERLTGGKNLFRNGGHPSVSLHERLVAALIIHVIICAEAVQSMNVFKPKMSRAYSKAFSTNAFVIGFRDLVSILKNHENRRILYWMRQMWNSCLVDEYLSKIDGNYFWHCRGIRYLPLPAHLHLKRRVEVEVEDGKGEEVSIIAQIDKSQQREEVATVVLYSSEDEVETDTDIAAKNPTTVSINSASIPIKNLENRNAPLNTPASIYDIDESVSVENRPTVPESQLVDRKPSNPQRLSLELRRRIDHIIECHDWLSKWFVTEDRNYRTIFQIKYSRRTLNPCPSLFWALDKFREQVLDLFFPVEEKKFYDAAKEAFLIQAEFGFNGTRQIAEFLVSQLLRGFDFCKSYESKVSSRFISLVLIHIIIGVETVCPGVLPDIDKKPFIRAFKNQQAVSRFVKRFQDIVFPVSVQCMVQVIIDTWIPYISVDSSADKINSRALPTRNGFMEGFIVNKMIRYIEEINSYDKEEFSTIRSNKEKTQDNSSASIDGMEIGNFQNVAPEMMNLVEENTQIDASSSVNMLTTSPTSVADDKEDEIIKDVGKPQVLSNAELPSDVGNVYVENIVDVPGCSNQNVAAAQVIQTTDIEPDLKDEVNCNITAKSTTTELINSESISERELDPVSSGSEVVIKQESVDRVFGRKNISLPVNKEASVQKDKSQMVLRRQSQGCKINYYAAFRQNRHHWLSKWFIPDNGRKNFTLSRSRNLEKELNAFHRTIFDLFVSIEEKYFYDAAKKALLIQKEFGSNGARQIAEFLVGVLLGGFEFCKSDASKLYSQLISLTMIHIIIAVESLCPGFVPDIDEKLFIKSFKNQQAISSFVEILQSTNYDIGIQSRVQFLIFTWIPHLCPDIDETQFAELHAEGSFKNNCFKEAAHILSLIKYLKWKLKENKLLFIQEHSTTRGQKRKSPDNRSENNEDYLEGENASSHKSSKPK